MAATKRAQPATHPSVYVGLALAAVGLLLALYSYTGTRIYDVRFALVALLGALLAIAGIFTSAWGRAIMTARAQRSRRNLMRDDAVKVVEEAGIARPPTLAAPESKKRLDLSKWTRRKQPPAEEGAGETPKAAGGAFAFRRRASAPPPPAPPNDEAASGSGSGPAVALAPPAATAAAEPPAPAAPVASPPAGAVERITVKCTRCATPFTVEGVRPLPIQCPSCGLAGTL